MNEYNYDNEIIEISKDEEVVLEEPRKVKSRKNDNKKSFKEKWKGLSKKNKTLIIGGIIFLIVLIIVVILMVFLKKDKDVDVSFEPVIIEKDNYRYEDGKLVFLDDTEKVIGTYECVKKDSDKCFVAKLDNSSDTFERVIKVDKNGSELEITSQIYLNKYVFVSDDEKIKLFDISTQEELLEVESIKSYNTEKNLVIVQKDNKYGLIEITDVGYEFLIRCFYDNLGILNTELELLVASTADDTILLDISGKELSEDISANIKSANKEFIVAEKNNTYNLYSYDFEELLSDYDYISLHNNVIALVKGNRLYLRDYNLSKLNADGIRLENNNYQKKYVYDEKGKLIETKESYEIKVKDNIASINIGTKTENINIAEGEVSANLNYISYYDGNLYFYSDEEKEDLIGTYSCQNKNNLKNSDSNLANCNIYTNAKGMSGIYNNEYVFIYDNSSNQDAKIYLYNIKGKAKKGTYSNIKIINEQELTLNVKHNYTSSSYIIAQSATGNNKGNYGVLEVNSEKVAGKVGFKYESITKEKNYYLLINIDKSYSVYDTKFNKVSNEFDYIEIYDNYYVGINDNKLNVYRYDNALGILEKDLTVTSNEFEIDFNNGFNITTGGVTYNYGVNGKVVEGEQHNEE